MHELVYVIIIIGIIIMMTQKIRTIENLSGSVSDPIMDVGTVYNNNILDIDAMFVMGNLNIAGGFNIIPHGIISPFAGNSVPAGWTLCDGTQETPDLRDYFVMGQSTTNTFGSNGGNPLPINIILQDNNMPAHQHSIQWYTRLTKASIQYPKGGNAYWFDLLNHGDTSNIGGVSQVTSGNTSENSQIQPITITPPYYALMYIMKL